MLVGVEWSTPRPCPFNFGKKLRYPLQRRLGGPQDRFGRVWRRKNIFLTQEFVPEQSSPLAIRYQGPFVLVCAHKNSLLYIYIYRERERELSVDVANVICDTSIYLGRNSCIMYTRNFVHKSCLLRDIKHCFVCILSEFLSSLIWSNLRNYICKFIQPGVRSFLAFVLGILQAQLWSGVRKRDSVHSDKMIERFGEQHDPVD